MKKYLHFSRFLVLLVGLLTISANSAWGENATYTKVTSSLTDWSGDYLIVYESGNVAFDGSLTTLDATNNGTAVTISDGSITTDSKYEFHITKDGDVYYIQSASGYYIWGTSSNGLSSNSTKSSAKGNTISYSEGIFTIKGSGGTKTLSYNNDTGQKRFRYLGTTLIQLYRKSGGVTYTDYLTECESCDLVGEELSVTAAATTLTIGSDDKASTTLSTSGGNNGTITFSVTPADKATISGYSITFTEAGTYTVTASQDKTADGKCSQRATVDITVNPRLYTLTFVDRGNTHTTQQHIAGEKATKPADPTGVCTEPINYEFVGWTEEPVDAQSTYSEVNFDTYTMPKKDTKLYAVYRYVEDGALGNDFEMISSVEELDSGADYVIAAYANSSDYALKNVVNTDGKAESVAVVCDENNIITTTDNTIIWKIAGNSTEGYTFYNNACKKYIDLCLDGTYVILNLTESPTYKYKITMTSTAGGTETSITSTLENTYNVFSYYNSLFNAYKSCNYNIYLYKRAVASKYTTSPACGPYVRVTAGKEVYVTAGNAGGTRSSVQVQDTVKFVAGSLKGNGSNQPRVKIPAEDIKIGDEATTNLTCDITQEVTGNGDGTYSISGYIVLKYKPTDFDKTEDIQVKLRAEYNTTNVSLDSFTVHARALPKKFVIAAKHTDGNWYALNGDMSGSKTQFANAHLEVNNTDAPTQATLAACNTLYTFDGMPNGGDLRYVRFIGTKQQYLWAAKGTNTGIQNNDAKNQPTALDIAYNWLLQTNDNKTYQFANMYNSRTLALHDQNGIRYGMYADGNGTHDIRILSVVDTCVYNYAPTNIVVVARSTTATLTWDAVAGADKYQYRASSVEDWKDGTSSPTITLSRLTKNTEYTYFVRAVHGTGSTICSDEASVTFTTTDCNDVPYDISYTSDVNSITLSWTMTAGTATVQVYSDSAGTTQVGSYEGKSSPHTITGLTKATTYYVKILADGSCSSALVKVSTERPQLDVVEWKPNGIDVAINTNEKISVILENQVTKGTGTGNVAEDLFFSKYFEAHSTNKMLGIYNGTPNKIALAAYSIAISAGGEFSLSRFGKETGYIDAGEEIILVQYSSTNSAKTCAQEQEGWEDWFETQSSGDEYLVMQMSGRQSLGLYKNSVLIDVIGSSTSSDGMGQLNELAKDACSSSKLIIEGIAVNDAPSFFSMQGDNISTENIETDYALTTNRCLLVRKNSVTSGKDAVLKNVTTSSVCADISASFVTLGEEWMGLRIGSGKSSNTEIQEATCTGLSYLGHFDYSGYYTTYDVLKDTIFDDTKRNPDGTMTINIPRMDTLACKGLKIIAKDEGGNVLTTKDYKVPILVTRNATTADNIFSHFGGDTCKTCDVVVRDNAILTKAKDGAPNDKPQVRDVKIYEGASLVVPSGTNYTVNSLSLRRREDAVAVVDVVGTLKLSSTSDKPVYLDMRINAENWHWFTLPYDCAIKDVTWSNGQPAKYRTDWFLMYYDGAHRATGVDSGNWKEYDGDSIAAGQGFIIGIKGDGNDKHAYELRFPMAKEVITDDATNKNVEVYAYGAGTEVRPNHKGWNLVGNPYLNYYKKGNINSFDGLQLSKLIYDPVTGWYSLGTDNNPYVVIPQNFGWSAYKQELVSEQDLLPFTSYFIQVGKDEGYTDGQKCEVLFDKDKRGKSAKAALMTSAAEEAEEEPVITGIVLRNAQGEEDETSLVIAERFGSSYEMGADFFKWFGDYYKYYTLPVLYSIGDDGGKRAFNAVNEEGAKQSIPLGMYAARDGQYTFSLNTRSDLSRVDKVWLYDAESGRYTDLLREDYTFATTRTEGSGRFFLSVVLKEKEITTSAANARYGDLTLYADKQTLVVRGLPEAAEVWVYDPSGKLLHHEQTRHYERQYEVPQQGTYLVRVESQDGGVTLRGVCR